MLVDTSDGYKYVGQSGSAAMLTVKRSAGLAPEVNLRNSMQARKHASEFTLALKPRADVTRSPKQGYQWPHKKDMCPPKTLKKKPFVIHLSKNTALCSVIFLNFHVYTFR